MWFFLSLIFIINQFFVIEIYLNNFYRLEIYFAGCTKREMLKAWVLHINGKVIEIITILIAIKNDGVDSIALDRLARR